MTWRLIAMLQNVFSPRSISLCFLVALGAGPTLAVAQSQGAANDSVAAFQEAMVQQLNNARARPRDCGGERFDAAPPLAWDDSLAAAAKGHSQDMVAYDFVSHTGSDGLGSGERATAAGYEWRAIAENIAAGQPGVDAVVNAWLGSPDHCRNIMRGVYEDVGAARVKDEIAGNRPYWTLVLGKSR